MSYSGSNEPRHLETCSAWRLHLLCIFNKETGQAVIRNGPDCEKDYYKAVPRLLGSPFRTSNPFLLPVAVSLSLTLSLYLTISPLSLAPPLPNIPQYSSRANSIIQ